MGTEPKPRFFDSKETLNLPTSLRSPIRRDSFNRSLLSGNSLISDSQKLEIMNRFGIDLERISVRDYINFINSKVNVNRFMAIAGININDKHHLEILNKQGRNIRNYFNERNERYERSKEKYKEVQQKMAMKMNSMFAKKINSRRQTLAANSLRPEVVQPKKENLYDNVVSYRMINRKVEQELLKNPLRVKGMGLSDEFRQLFDKKEDRLISYKQTKKATMQTKKKRQISIEQAFHLNEQNYYRKQDQILKSIKKVLEPVKQLITEQQVNKEELQKLDGVEILS